MVESSVMSDLGTGHRTDLRISVLGPLRAWRGDAQLDLGPTRQRALLAGVFAAAHAGQFLCNVPIAIGGGRRGESLWDVLSGPMLFIFAVDFTLMLANAVVAAGLLTSAL